MEYQIYAVHHNRDIWHILKAPIPCNAGEGEFLKSVRTKNVRKAIKEMENPKKGFL